MRMKPVVVIDTVIEVTSKLFSSSVLLSGRSVVEFECVGVMATSDCTVGSNNVEFSGSAVDETLIIFVVSSVILPGG